MNLFKYALKNLRIYKYRSIVIGIIMFLVITASVVGTSIQRTTQEVSDKYRSQIGAAVDIEVDFEKSTGGYAPEPITAKQYKEIAKSKYVQSYSYLTEVMLGSDKIKAVGEDEQKAEDKMGIVGAGDNGEPVRLETPKLKLIGGGGNAELPEFKKGSRKVIEGTEPKSNSDILISKELAKLNNLKIGDTVQLKDAKGKSEKDFKVSGIYEDKTKTDGGTGIDMPIFNRRNEIITKFESAMSMDSEGMAQVRATYELKNPENFENFKKEVRELGISDAYSISIDKASFDKAVGPINNLNSTVSYFIGIILIIAVGVLILLSVLSVRERQYEIGVLRSIGMKKGKIGLNFITESCIILFIALVIGFNFGKAVTKPVANSLLQKQIVEMNKTAEEDKQSKAQANMFTPDKTDGIKTVDKIDVKIDYLILLKIAGIGFGIVIVSNLVNIIYIMKLQPMKIMRSKN